ncbi:MAG: DUF4332 domain-containing protein [Anaerolineae bacterium]
MSIALGKLNGITTDIQSKLKARSIYDSDQLLAVARTPADRHQLARQIDVEPALILHLANRADLARVRGIGTIFAQLLEAAGVDTVKELATRQPTNLHAALLTANTQLQLTRRAPSADMVRAWVAEAKRMSPALEY